MARPENPIEATGPAADFAAELRLLRGHAGLTLRELAAATGYSTATLSTASAGRYLPTWEVTSAFVQACGGGSGQWRERWEQAASFSRVPAAIQAPRADAAAGIPPRGHGATAYTRVPAAPPPLPVTAETPAEFADFLLRVKIWAGDPPVRAIARRAGMPPSTMYDFLSAKRGKLPGMDAMLAFLKACGVGDPVVLGEWVYAWRRLKFAEVDQRRRRGSRNLAAVVRPPRLRA